MTAAEELVLVDAAIAAILTGGIASYTINGRSVTRVDLGILYRRKAELQVVVNAAATRGPSRTFVKFPEPQ